MPADTGNTPETNAPPKPRVELRTLIELWQELETTTREIKETIARLEAEMEAEPSTRITNTGKIAALRAELSDEIVPQREARRDEVIAFVSKHPRLADEAVSWGFKRSLLSGAGLAPSQNGDSKDTDGNPTGGGGGDTSGSRTGGGSGGGGTSGGGGNNRWLPGIEGKDYVLVSYKGKVFAKYKVAHAGNFTMWIPPDKYKTYGVRPERARQLTTAQYKKLNSFGNAADILVHGETRHPFRQWVEQTEALYGGTGLLKNKEVMRVFLEGYTKGWSQEVIAGKLRQTKWFDSSTEYTRQWSMAMTSAEKKGQINSIGNQIKTGLAEIYGDNWLEFFPDWDPKQLDTWAKKIATGVLGATGSPSAAMELFIRNQTKKAEAIEGTPAWIAKQQRLQEQGEFLGRPEDVREQLRQQAIRSLGYAGKDARIDSDTLTQWAERIAYSQMNAEGNPYTQADFDQYLRRQKNALFPYLDPDEDWQDAASTYKAKAEQLIGRTLSWDDRLLSDFAAKDENGNPTGARLSDWDFERQARKDNRFWKGKVAAEEGYGLLSKLQETFNGRVM